MKFYKSFLSGIKSYSEAHQLVVRHKLWGYVLLPGIINIIIFAFVVWTGYHYSGKISTWFMDTMDVDKGSNNWLNFAINTLNFFVSFIVTITFIFIYLYVYKYIVLIIMSPILALLSEKTDTIITGTLYSFSLSQLFRDIIRGNKIVARNMFIELLFMILFFFLGFIPFIGFFSPIFMFIISMYFYGFSMIDYSSERYRYSIAQSIQFVRKNKGYAIANGLVFYCILLIPVLGLLLAPTYAVVAATIGANKLKTIH